MPWYEYTPPSKYSVPDKPDTGEARAGAAFMLFFLGVVALAVMLGSILFRAWTVFWVALAVMWLCAMASGILIPKVKPKRVIE